MTALSINNQSVKIEQLDNASEQTSLLGFAEKILNNDEYKDAVLTQLTVDGETIAFDQEKDFFSRPLSQFSDVNFHMVSSLELAYEALESCSNYVDNLTERIHHLVHLYQANEIQKANDVFAEMIELLDLFIQLVSHIHVTLNRHQPEIIKRTEGLQKLEIHLLSVMKAILPAKEKNDVIMLCDLLEYELIDNLTQWKIDIIPQFKKLKTN